MRSKTPPDAVRRSGIPQCSTVAVHQIRLYDGRNSLQPYTPIKDRVGLLNISFRPARPRQGRHLCLRVQLRGGCCLGKSLPGPRREGQLVTLCASTGNHSAVAPSAFLLEPDLVALLPDGSHSHRRWSRSRSVLTSPKTSTSVSEPVLLLGRGPGSARRQVQTLCRGIER